MMGSEIGAMGSHGVPQRVLAGAVRVAQRARLLLMGHAALEELRHDLDAVFELAELDLRHAVALFQKRQGLPVTGHPDRGTRRALTRMAGALEERGVVAGAGDDLGVVAARTSLASLRKDVDRLQLQVDALAKIAGGGPPLPPPVGGGGPRRRVVSWMSMPAGDQRRLVRVVFDGDPSQYVLKRLAQDGMHRYEPETIATVLAANEMTGGGFLDIGANIGVFAVVVKSLQPTTAVTAFEPGPDLAATCREVVELNELDVAVEELALAERDGDAAFYISPTDTSNSLRPGFRRSIDVLTVSVARLDTWLGTNAGPDPSVLKIDTESTEPDVLDGSGEFVGRARPWLVVEVLKGRTEDRLEAWCEELGYHRHHIRADGPVEAPRIEGDEQYEYLNWLLTPGEIPAAFEDAFLRWRAVLQSAVTLEISQ